MHPGFVDYDLIQSSSLTMDRGYEHALLCDPKVKECLKRQQVELLSFRDL